MLKKKVTDEFNKEVTRLFSNNPSILKFVLEHERKDLCINNIVKEIKLAEEVINISKEHLKMLTKDFAVMFAKAALKLKEEQILSDAERARQIKENADQEEYQKMLETDDMAQLQEYAEDTK